MKKKPILIIMAVVVLLAIGAFIYMMYPADYKECVEKGGETTDIVAPSTCMFNGVEYYDGNY